MHVQAEMVGPDGYDPKAEQEEFRRIAKLKPSGILVSAVMTAISTRNAGDLPGSHMAKAAVFDSLRDTGDRFDGRLVTQFAEMVALGAVTA